MPDDAGTEDLGQGVAQRGSAGGQDHADGEGNLHTEQRSSQQVPVSRRRFNFFYCIDKASGSTYLHIYIKQLFLCLQLFFYTYQSISVEKHCKQL